MPRFPVSTAIETSKSLLAAEFIGLFIGIPFIFALSIHGMSPVPFLLAGGLVSAWYLVRDKKFSRSSFGNLLSLKKDSKRIGVTFLFFSLLAMGLIFFFYPQHLFSFPRKQTAIWLSIMIFYPLLAVYPQELIFRGFLFRRYHSLFPNKKSMIHASALVFGFAHIIYGNVPAVILALIGGYLFALTYQRSKSILTVSVEHALYGCLLYTIGFGHFILTS